MYQSHGRPHCATSAKELAETKRNSVDDYRKKPVDAVVDNLSSLYSTDY